MTVALTSNFFANARGLTLKDGGGITWSINQTTNEITATGSGGGVLSSVGLEDDSTTPIYTVGNSPLTANGTLTVTLKTQNANRILAGPTTGSAAQPSFRALVAADLPVNGANPTASVGLTVVNGSATTWMRSDAAPALSQAISPTWTGNHTFTPASGVGLTVNAVAGSYGAIFNGGAGQFATSVVGAASNSWGLYVQAGTSTSDKALYVVDAANSKVYMIIYGDGSVNFGGASGTVTGQGKVNATGFYVNGTQITGANPSASIGLTAVNGSAVTWMRSDAAPALSQSIAPKWTGVHAFLPTKGPRLDYQTASVTSSSASDVYRFLDSSGTLTNTSICGIFDIVAIDNATGANQAVYQLWLGSANNGASNVTLTQLQRLVRGTDVGGSSTPFSIAADGVAGAVKLQFTKGSATQINLQIVFRGISTT